MAKIARLLNQSLIGCRVATAESTTDDIAVVTVEDMPPESGADGAADIETPDEPLDIMSIKPDCTSNSLARSGFVSGITTSAPASPISALVASLKIPPSANSGSGVSLGTPANGLAPNTEISRSLFTSLSFMKPTSPL